MLLESFPDTCETKNVEITSEEIILFPFLIFMIFNFDNLYYHGNASNYRRNVGIHP